jgi:hypothetical protein
VSTSARDPNSTLKASCRPRIGKTGQGGKKRYRTEIVSRDIVLLGSRDNGQDVRGETHGDQSSLESAPAVVDDDIPF